MKQDDRVRIDRALQRARRSAYAPGEFVGQESFMSASDIRSLAVKAGIAPGVSVLDLCCGIAGPGRLIAAETQCSYLGVDFSREAIAFAAEQAGDLGCRFEVLAIPPLPPGRWDVVLLLETVLAFSDKQNLLREVAAALNPGGRFAFTLEEGPALTDAERSRMPKADTVWLTPLEDMHSCLARAGLQIRWQEECSRTHLAAVDALLDAFVEDASFIEAAIGGRALDDLLTAHRLWSDWLRAGRVRKFAVVGVKTSAP